VLGIPDARDLHVALKVKTRFDDWNRRATAKGFEKDIDFVPHLDSSDLRNQDGNGHGGDRRSIRFTYSLDMAKQVAMMENSEVGRLVRRYFLWCEQKATENTLIIRQPQMVLQERECRTIGGISKAVVHKELAEFLVAIRAEFEPRGARELRMLQMIAAQAGNPTQTAQRGNEGADLRRCAGLLGLRLRFAIRSRGAAVQAASGRPSLPTDNPSLLSGSGIFRSARLSPPDAVSDWAGTRPESPPR